MQGDRVARADRGVRLRLHNPTAVVDGESSGAARDRHRIVERPSDVVVSVGRENGVVALTAVRAAAAARAERMSDAGDLYAYHPGIGTDIGARRRERDDIGGRAGHRERAGVVRGRRATGIVVAKDVDVALATAQVVRGGRHLRHALRSRDRAGRGICERRRIAADRDARPEGRIDHGLGGAADHNRGAGAIAVVLSNAESRGRRGAAAGEGAQCLLAGSGGRAGRAGHHRARGISEAVGAQAGHDGVSRVEQA